MAKYSRRDFLRMGGLLAAGFGLGPDVVPALAQGLQRIFERQRKVLWLQGMSCTGCSISLLNSDEPGPLEIVTQMISVVFHPNLSAAQGKLAMDTIDKLIAEGKYYLVLEGAIAPQMPESCLIGGRPLTEILPTALQNAELILTAGSCAAFGGIPGAEGNPTGAIGLQEYMESKRMTVKGRLVNCPGCPVHPHTIVSVLAHAAGIGYPKVDPELLTPDMICKHSVHDDCPRFHYWQKEVFAEKFGEEGCLFKLGCLGPLSHSNCPQRQWNGGVNWCIRAGAPCVACTSKDFSKKRAFPFYRKGEQYHAVEYKEQDRGGKQQ
jgi:hydrogenase small subunit